MNNAPAGARYHSPGSFRLTALMYDKIQLGNRIYIYYHPFIIYERFQLRGDIFPQNANVMRNLRIIFKYSYDADINER